MILSALLPKKNATIPPKSDCASCFDQGFTALATKMPHLRCFWVGKDVPLVLSKPALIYNSLRACPDLKLAQDLPWSGATLGEKWTGRNLDNYGRKWFCQHCCRKKKQQYRQNQFVFLALTKAWQPWLQKSHPSGVLGFMVKEFPYR